MLKNGGRTTEDLDVAASEECCCVADDPLIARVLGDRYRIDGFVAEGGFGRVYRGFDPELNRPVAVKVAKAAAVKPPELLLDEARRVAQLRHPGIVPIHDVGRDGELWFFISDLIEGKSLAELDRKLSPKEAAEIVAQVADALHHAHEQGFVHQDIKPSNILMDGQGRPLITDFGIAVTKEEISDRNVPRSGTLPYMAPEQLIGEFRLISPRTDVYALGVVLFKILTGRGPYQAQTRLVLKEQILLQKPASLRSFNSTIPPQLEAVCLRCLAKHPADRFGSAAELAAALRSNQTHGARIRLAGLGVVLVAAIAAIWMMIPKQSQSLMSTTASPREVNLAAETGVFSFDGRNRIVTALESFAPCTLEAWVKTTGDRAEQYVVGSDVPTLFGIGFGIKNNVPIVETIRGGYIVYQTITPGTWTHLATVFGSSETVFYLNGKKACVGPATSPPTRRTHFVIGNVGEDHDELFFSGYVRSVRISRGMRYTSDFEPDESFGADAADHPNPAVLIYDGSKAGRGRVVDLSGNGNHGTAERLRQVAE